MVEIAVRALSPGVNDPYTAIACIDNLTSTMSYLAETKFPSKYRFDEEFWAEVNALLKDYVGRENPLYHAKNIWKKTSFRST